MKLKAVQTAEISIQRGGGLILLHTTSVALNQIDSIVLINELKFQDTKKAYLNRRP